MSTQVTLTLPDELYERAQHWAAITQQEIPQTLADALTIVLMPIHMSPELDSPVFKMSDAEIMALTQAQMESIQGERLGSLLAIQRESKLTAEEQSELLALMQVYNQLWIRQSQALAEAVKRGLHPPLES